jgi:transcriptional regulator CtsR
LLQLAHYVGDRITEKYAYELIQRLFDDQLISKREANLVLAMINDETLKDFSNPEAARAKVLSAFLKRLAYS